jgi:hypothetical protein
MCPALKKVGLDSGHVSGHSPDACNPNERTSRL